MPVVRISPQLSDLVTSVKYGVPTNVAWFVVLGRGDAADCANNDGIKTKHRLTDQVDC